MAARASDKHARSPHAGGLGSSTPMQTHTSPTHTHPHPPPTHPHHHTHPHPPPSPPPSPITSPISTHHLTHHLTHHPHPSEELLAVLATLGCSRYLSEQLEAWRHRLGDATLVDVERPGLPSQGHPALAPNHVPARTPTRTRREQPLVLANSSVSHRSPSVTRLDAHRARAPPRLARSSCTRYCTRRTLT